MKIIPSSKRHHYVAKFSIFLIAVVLITGMVGCDGGDGDGPFTLNISSTAGGNVTTPGEGTFTYDKGTVVDLAAEAEEGCYFVNWTGDVGTIANANDAATTITMNDNYFIYAIFGIEIRDWYDLDAIRDNLVGNHTLMNDLDSTTPGYEELASPTANQGKGWEPIRTTDDLFTGIFDGQGYEISDLFINRPDQNYVGLFYSVEEGGVIENVGVVNANVTGTQVVGGLMGVNDGTVSNSYSSGNVTGDVSGGLVGFNDIGTVSNSYSTSNVTGTQVVGGLMGFNDGTVSNSYSTGNVTGDEDVGGLVGDNWDTVSNSFWDTETSGQSTSDGGTDKTTAEMQDIATFSGAGWNIIEVAPGSTNSTYTWNIVDDETYPFLSWQS